MKIALITSGLRPKDERIYYHHALALAEAGYEVVIISSKEALNQFDSTLVFRSFSDTGMKKKQKTKAFIKRLDEARPDIILCHEPFSVVAAWKYRRASKRKVSIVFDIIEWYPSKKFMEGKNPASKVFIFFKLLFVNILSARLSHAFIFGEYYKSRPYRFFFPRKAFLISGYYPDLNYLPMQEPQALQQELRLSYSGKLTREKGFGRFLDLVDMLARRHPELSIHVKVIGWYGQQKEIEAFKAMIDRLPSQVSYQEYTRQPFEAYLALIKDTDIFLDLRDDDFENTHCLPIKLFYYAALQRPVIYTRLKAIEKEVAIERFGFTVKGGNVAEAIERVEQYLSSPQLYLQHSREARHLSESLYQWALIKEPFVRFFQQENIQE